MNIRFPGCYPVRLSASAAHWKKDGTHHGPRSSPKIASLRIVRLGSTPSPLPIGYRVWLYFRGGYALFADAYIDRREVRP